MGGIPQESVHVSIVQLHHSDLFMSAYRLALDLLGSTAITTGLAGVTRGPRTVLAIAEAAFAGPKRASCRRRSCGWTSGRGATSCSGCRILLHKLEHRLRQ